MQGLAGLLLANELSDIRGVECPKSIKCKLCSLDVDRNIETFKQHRPFDPEHLIPFSVRFGLYEHHPVSLTSRSTHPRQGVELRKLLPFEGEVICVADGSGISDQTFIELVSGVMCTDIVICVKNDHLV